MTRNSDGNIFIDKCLNSRSASIGVISKYHKALSAAKTKGKFCTLAKGMPYLEIYIAYVDLNKYTERVGGMYYITE